MYYITYSLPLSQPSFTLPALKMQSTGLRPMQTTFYSWFPKGPIDSHDILPTRLVGTKICKGDGSAYPRGPPPTSDSQVPWDGGLRGTPLQLPPSHGTHGHKSPVGGGPRGHALPSPLTGKSMMWDHTLKRNILPRVLYLLQVLPIHIPKTLFNVSLPRLIGIINQLGSLINPF